MGPAQPVHVRYFYPRHLVTSTSTFNVEHSHILEHSEHFVMSHVYTHSHTMEAPLRFAEHKTFLRFVHSAPGGGDELYLGRALPGAIERYVKFWLPLVAREGTQEGCAVLIPPVDVAWVWHLHRLAPLRYAAYCVERFGRVLDPGTSAFQAQAQSAADASDDETRRLWLQHFGDVEQFFQSNGEGITETGPRAEWGPRCQLSKQTTLSPEVKEACVRMRGALGFDYDAETCSARQRTFLWQVSQPACGDEGAASARYLQFLGLMKKHGYENHFFVPSYDIDFAWHTHMLGSTTSYLRETALLASAPGGVDHDDSVNQRHEESKLHKGWKETKEMWALEHGDVADPIDQAGVTYRGEPPDWWFCSDPSDIFHVHDDFLSKDELEAALDSLRCEANVRARAHSGLDMVCQVSADVMRRLREQLIDDDDDDAEEEAEEEVQEVANHRQNNHGANRPSRAEPEPKRTEREKKEHRHEHEHEHECTYESSTVEVPARVCPASKSVPQHKDKLDGKGVCVSSWICVVYLTRQPDSALVLTDDVTGREFRVTIEPGRMCRWPNARFSHRVDADVDADADAVVTVTRGASPVGFRCMLGPMALHRTAGKSPNDINKKDIVYTEGGCGGGGCGGGGCGGGGCGGGGGGGTPAITDTSTRRIVGSSTLSSVMLEPKGTAASRPDITFTFSFSPYNPEYTTFFNRGTVPYMTETAISPAVWRQLQMDIQRLEGQLAQIADQSTPLEGCEPCTVLCVSGAREKIDAIKQVAAFIKATRDVHMAIVNLQLDSMPCPPDSRNAPRNVRLCFGGSNSVYYLDAVPRLAEYSPEAELAVARSEELSAREGLPQFGIAPPASGGAVPPVSAPSDAAPPLMTVQVPAGLSGGQSLQVQGPMGMMIVEIPPGLTAGHTFQLHVPPPPPPPQESQQQSGIGQPQHIAPVPPTAQQMN